MRNYAPEWAKAMTFEDFLAKSGTHFPLWEGLYKLARFPDWSQLVTGGRILNLLVIAEDWCGDASNTIPFLAHWTAVTPGVSLRVIRRDENLEIMDRYLTNGSRSIPIVIVLDENLAELGHWGPRPRELQQWVMDHRTTIPKAELYPQVRKWYARDKGETTLREVLQIALGESFVTPASHS
ncbi:MAG: thioredoxin family protein [Gemmatimonadota bacterium]